MCGIDGVFTDKPADYEPLIREMNAAQKHRGPDDSGVFCDEYAAFGQVRLSILDLSALGHQPFLYMDKYVICYNGEVYNYLEIRTELCGLGYTFRTETDTEVIAAAYDMWGADCLPKFNGMWALTIYDKIEHTLFMSRDRYGVKPIYYYQEKGRLVFASEIKALLMDKTIPRYVNDSVVFDYLVNGFVDCGTDTFFKGIYSFPPASYALIALDNVEDNISFMKYYSVPFEESLVGSFTSETVEEFRWLFEDSVRLRLRSDVAVGSCLSGGLDSSSIVCCSSALLREQGQPFEQKTFSSHYVDFSEVDETHFINDVIAETGVNGFFVEPSADTLLSDFDDLLFVQEQPFVSTSMYASYCVMRLAHESDVKVLLDGQGADELLCGYRKARVYYLKRLFQAKRYPTAIKESVAYLPYARKSTSSFKSDLSMAKQFIGKRNDPNAIKKRYLSKPFANQELTYSYKVSENFLLDDFDSIVLPSLLRYVDRNSMAFSIEDRLPFLDYRLVDYCMKLPLNAKINNGESKAIMRRALAMPESVRKRKDKIGFATPEKQWLSSFSDFYKETFASKDFRAGKYINNALLVQSWDDVIRRDDIGVFRYYCLEKWMQRFDMKVC